MSGYLLDTVILFHAAIRMRVLGLNGSIFQGRKNILLFQKRIIFKNLSVRCPCTEKTKDIAHADAVAADTRTTTAFSWFESDTSKSFRVHSVILGGEAYT